MAIKKNPGHNFISDISYTHETTILQHVTCQYHQQCFQIQESHSNNHSLCRPEDYILVKDDEDDDEVKS